MSNTRRTEAVPCPNCGRMIVMNLCSKDWCPNCGQRFCCADNACLERVSADLWEAHQELLILQAAGERERRA